jgi:hypothetical protein
MSETLCFSSITRTTSKLYFTEQGCDFKPNATEIGTLSNVSFER